MVGVENMARNSAEAWSFTDATYEPVGVDDVIVARVVQVDPPKSAIGVAQHQRCAIAALYGAGPCKVGSAASRAFDPVVGRSGRNLVFGCVPTS